jgi:hypothetical protein
MGEALPWFVDPLPEPTAETTTTQPIFMAFIGAHHHAASLGVADLGLAGSVSSDGRQGIAAAE